MPVTALAPDRLPLTTTPIMRLAITHELKRLMREHLDYGLLLEGLAATEYFPGKDRRQ